VHVLENIPKTILSLMLGRNVPIAGVTIPDFSIVGFAEWRIPIWAFPQIDIVLQLSAGIKFSIGEIMVTRYFF